MKTRKKTAGELQEDVETEKWWKRLSYGDKLELKMGDGTASKFERWVWDHFFDPETGLPSEQRAVNVNKRTREKLAAFQQRVHETAVRNGLTDEELILRYFHQLSLYVELKKDLGERHPDTITQRQKLADVFKDMTVLSLLQIGEPYFFERGWFNGKRVKTLEEFYYEQTQNTPSSRAVVWSYDRISFLFDAGFTYD